MNHNFNYASSVVRPIGLDKDTLVHLYKHHLVRGTGSTFYEELKTGVNGERLCAYCDIREAETLDHYKEKKDFPLLATAPCNLVPSCMKCNHNMAKVVDKYHAYYDPPLPEKWLRARLIWDGTDEPPGVRYFSTRRSASDPALRDRIRDTLHNGALSARWATEFSQPLRSLYRDFYDIADIDERQNIVRDTFSRRLHTYPGPLLATRDAVLWSRWLRKWRV